jgi:hypothetical protein
MRAMLRLVVTSRSGLFIYMEDDIKLICNCLQYKWALIMKIALSLQEKQHKHFFISYDLKPSALQHAFA